MKLDTVRTKDPPPPSGVEAQEQNSGQKVQELLSSHAQRLVDTVIQWQMQQQSLLQRLLLPPSASIPNEESLQSAVVALPVAGKAFECQATSHPESKLDLRPAAIETNLTTSESPLDRHSTRGSSMDSSRPSTQSPGRQSSKGSFSKTLFPSLSRTTFEFGDHVRTKKMGSVVSDAHDSSYALESRKSVRSLEGLSALVIMANSITIGVGADLAAKEVISSGKLESHPVFRALEVAFTVYYFGEMVARIRMQGAAFFGSGSRAWNIFDVGLVIQSFWDSFHEVVFDGKEGSNLSFLRMLRLFKMMRLLRMFRLLRFFRELRLILRSIFGCVKSVIWAVVLLMVMAYLFGVTFVQATSAYLATNRTSSQAADLQYYWGSISRAVNSLVMTSFGGEDWAILANPLWHCGQAFYLLFVFYVLLFHIVILNTISSIFFEAMISNAQSDQAEQITIQIEKKAEYTQMLRELYSKLNPDGDGEIIYEKFVELIETQPEMRAFAESLDIDLFDAKQFFMVLSSNGKYPVDLDSFVVGCTKLKGYARSLDMLDLLYLQRNATKRQEEFFQIGGERLTAIKNHLVPEMSL